MKKHAPLTSFHRRLGRRIEARRKQLGFTQEQLAFEAGLDRAYLSEIERGVGNPTLNTLIKLALALKFVPKDLLD